MKHIIIFLIRIYHAQGRGDRPHRPLDPRLTPLNRRYFNVYSMILSRRGVFVLIIKNATTSLSSFYYNAYHIPAQKLLISILSFHLQVTDNSKAKI